MNSWVEETNVTDGNILLVNSIDTTISADSSITLTYNEYYDWLPPASSRKKYFPSWHLVRSYA